MRTLSPFTTRRFFILALALLAVPCAAQKADLEKARVQAQSAPGCAVTLPLSQELTPVRAVTPSVVGPNCSTLPPTSLGLLVAWDTALRATHTDAQIRAWIDARVAEANAIFVNSGAPVRYDPVFIREVSPPLPDTEPTTTQRARVREILTDWVRDQGSVLRRLRDGYGADLAILVTTPYIDRVGSQNADVCGVGNLPLLGTTGEVLSIDPSQSFTDQAFAVIEFGCGLSASRNDLTFAHELGHTFGMNHGDVEVSGAVASYGKGALLASAAPTPPLATVMHCSPLGGPVKDGVCNRIPHFSSPLRTYTIPVCQVAPCTVTTGSPDRDNARLLCSRAERYAAFRTPNGNQPPTVRITAPAPGLSVQSGTVVIFSAVANDPEQGNLTSAIQWIDRRGQILGTGASLQRQLLQPGDPIGARITDAGGKVDEWWYLPRVTWPSDGYQDDVAAVLLPFGTWQVRNFDRSNDIDRVQTPGLAAGQRVRIDVSAFGRRAVPSLQIAFCDATLGCSAPEPATPPYVSPALVRPGFFTVTITGAAQAAGFDTGYVVRADLYTPPAVTPLMGPWYNPARSGNGVDFQPVGPGRYVAIWYTYRANGTPTWYISDVAPLLGTSWRAPLYASTWDGTRNHLSVVGSLAFTFSGTRNASMSWSFTQTGARGAEPFLWFEFDAGPTGPANGTWYPPSQSGWGASISQQGSTFVFTSYTYDPSGQPTWAQGVARESHPSSVVINDMNQFNGGNSLCPGCTGTGTFTTLPGAGTVWFRLTSPGQALLDINLTYRATPGTWRRTNIPFTRLTGN